MWLLILLLSFDAQAQSYSSGRIVSVRDAGRELALKGCERPGGLREEPVATMRKDVSVTRRSFTCPDAQMVVLRAGERTLPYTLAVTGDKTRVTDEVRTGMLAKDVREMFGKPDVERGQVME